MIDLSQQIQIRSEGEMAHILRDRYQSGEWWFFLPLDSRGIAELTAIENKFYAPGTERNDDFEALARLSRTGLFGVGLGHKRRLPRRKLEKYLKRRGAQIGTIQAEQDVLLLGQGTDGSAAMERLQSLLEATLIRFDLN